MRAALIIQCAVYSDSLPVAWRNASIARSSTAKPEISPETACFVKPATIYAMAEEIAAVSAYGIWVDTWLMCRHCAPALDMMVVSEIGEQ